MRGPPSLNAVRLYLMNLVTYFFAARSGTKIVSIMLATVSVSIPLKNLKWSIIRELGYLIVTLMSELTRF